MWQQLLERPCKSHQCITAIQQRMRSSDVTKLFALGTLVNMLNGAAAEKSTSSSGSNCGMMTRFFYKQNQKVNPVFSK